MSKILLGMSGGTDSSVAAWILKRDAHEVVGVTFRFHDSPQRSAAIMRAQRCAEQLGIEHHVIDMRERFAQLVKETAARDFARGLFVNPCTTCMREVKIPALFSQMDAFGCEFVATGHYARVTRETEGFQLKPYQLRKPLDKSKDQTFLLYTLTQEQMAHLILPLEDVHKGEARRMAMQQGLMRIAPVNDGQGEPCFYNGMSYVNWLEGEGGLSPDVGDIVYAGDDSVVGAYEGQYRYAPDESLGTFTIVSVPEVAEANGEGEGEEEPQPVPHDEELFVVFKDVANGRMLAATRASAGTEMCLLRDVRWTSIEPPEEKRSCRARISYEGKPLPAQAICKDEGVVVAFSERVRGVRPGQPIVLYSDDLVLGGGIVVG